MTIYARKELRITDDAGNLMPGSSTVVRRESTNALATLYSDRYGTTLLDNPLIDDDADGKIAFHAPGGVYKIVSSLDGFEDTMRYVAIGTGAEIDIAAFTAAARTVARVATTANITISTALNNGDTIDDITLATNDRVLVKSQTTKSQNGVYVVGAVPARATDFDTYDEHAGTIVAVSEGTANAGKLYYGANSAGGTLDTTSIEFVSIVFPTVESVLDELGVHNITISTSDPSGGQDGDLWFKVPT